MRTILRSLFIINLLVASVAANSQMIPNVMLLDSVYVYNWASNNWSLNTKDYITKNQYGQNIESLFKKYNNGTSQFVDFVRFLNDYTGSSAVPTTTTNQFWYNNIWNTYQYIHYMQGDIIDTTYLKTFDYQHLNFNNGVKNIIQYNDSLLPIQNISQIWDTTLMDWVNSSRTTFTYTPSMLPADRIISSWQGVTSTWENVYKYSEVYDANNLLINHYEYIWKSSTSDWSSTFRSTYYNNATTLPYLVVKEEWDSTLFRWDSLEQTTYIYNQFNWLMTVLTKDYQLGSGTWVNSSLTYYSYSPGGVQQSLTENIWNTINNNWIIDSYQILDSATQKVAEAYTRIVDLQTFQIINGTRYIYTYNPAGDTAVKETQGWNVAGNDWIINNQVTYTYDSQKLLTEELMQDWDPAGSAWVNSEKSDYYYSDFIGIGEHSAKEKLCFYANPMVAGNSIRCPSLDPSKSYQFELFTLTGSRVMSEEVNNGASFSIKPSLASGNYILRISDNGKMISQDKIIVIN